MARICSGSQKERSDVQNYLERLAQRIVSSPEGTFAPSPPPALLDALTDEQLVMASDVLAAAAAQVQQPPSGKAQQRLLAWLLADARGATALLDKEDAQVAGKASAWSTRPSACASRSPVRQMQRRCSVPSC